jgi:hypothetical protein
MKLGCAFPSRCRSLQGDGGLLSSMPSPRSGLNITGCYADTNKTGITFIVLDSEAEGRKFHHVLEEAL